MFRLLLILSLLTFYQPSYAGEDTVNQAVARYLTRIHKYMEEEDWENAERELIQTARRYFKNEDSYERALINQLYGQFYALQRDYKSAIPWFEKASILVTVFETFNFIFLIKIFSNVLLGILSCCPNCV